MSREHIRRAIAEKRLLEFHYKKAVRLAEPHDYGVIGGTEHLLVFQLRGPNSGKGAVGWRLLDIAKIEKCVVTEQTFAGSRGQSHQQHYKWETLYARELGRRGRRRLSLLSLVKVSAASSFVAA